ncbi:MAG: hypothetical protein ACO3DQ_09500 [Cephaloticoccus sp.]
MKKILNSTVSAGSIAAALILSLGLSLPISIDVIVAYAATGMLMALAISEYVTNRKRLQVK